jgi:hypothetical protein
MPHWFITTTAANCSLWCHSTFPFECKCAVATSIPYIWQPRPGLSHILLGTLSEPSSVGRSTPCQSSKPGRVHHTGNSTFTLSDFPTFRLSDFPIFRPIAVNYRTIFFFRDRCEQRGLYCMAVAFLPTTSTSLLALYAVLTAFHSLGALPHLAHSRSTLNLRSLISPDPAMAALPAVLWS